MRSLFQHNVTRISREEKKKLVNEKKKTSKVYIHIDMCYVVSSLLRSSSKNCQVSLYKVTGIRHDKWVNGYIIMTTCILTAEVSCIAFTVFLFPTVPAAFVVAWELNLSCQREF